MTGLVAQLLAEGSTDQQAVSMGSFVAVGDIMLGDSASTSGFGFHSTYPRRANEAFTFVSSLLRRGEVVLGNLECVLSPVGKGSTRLRRDQMRGSPEYALCLRDAGFTALAVANNHSMQHGADAFERTVHYLKSAGIDCIGLRGTNGWCCAPIVQTTRSGLRIGLLGYCWRPRQYDQTQPLYAEGDVDAVAEDVKRLRASSDAVVVSLHWGEEFVEVPSQPEVAAARRLIEAGASILVGHHPHVMRPIERYRQGIICYSLGNFVSDMLWSPQLRNGAAMQCRVSADKIADVRVTPTEIDDLYRVTPSASEITVVSATTGLAPAKYRQAVSDSLKEQRLAAYKYALVNIRRFPIPVLADLLYTTLMNKLRVSMIRRMFQHPIKVGP